VKIIYQMITMQGDAGLCVENWHFFAKFVKKCQL
jgi:hypothetical protein